MTYAKPRGDRVAALHPAEDPGDGAEIFEAATFAAPRRTRADTRVLQFVHRRRLLEIFDHVGIFGDVVAIKTEGLGGHLFHGRRPALVRSRLRPASTGDGFHAGSDHDLQVPLGENGIGIFPVEDLALFGDANFAGKIADRLGENGGVGRSATAANRAAAAVKQAQLHVVFAGRAMQFVVGLVQLPDAGQHAAVFVGIGIAEHDFLPASPGVEQRLIIWRAPDAFHNRGRTAQVIDGFKQRNRHKPGVIRGRSDLHAAGRGQFRDREHVILGLRSADDVVANCAGRISLLQLLPLRGKCREHPGWIPKFPGLDRRG